MAEPKKVENVAEGYATAEDIGFAISIFLCRRPSPKALSDLADKSVKHIVRMILGTEEFAALVNTALENKDKIQKLLTTLDEDQVRWLKFFVIPKEHRKFFSSSRSTRIEIINLVLGDKNTQDILEMSALDRTRYARFLGLSEANKLKPRSKAELGRELTRLEKSSQVSTAEVEQQDQLQDDLPAQNPLATGHVLVSTLRARAFGDFSNIDTIVDKIREAPFDKVSSIMKDLFDKDDDAAISYCYNILKNDSFGDIRKVYVVSFYAARSFTRKFMFASALNVITALLSDERSAHGLQDDQITAAEKLLANCFIRTGQFEAGIDLYNKILVRRPWDMEAHYLYGFVRSVQDPAEGRFHLNISARAGAGVPRPIKISIAEHFRANGWTDDYFATVSSIVSDKTVHPEAFLLMQNYCLSIESQQSAARHLEQFFSFFDLPAPAVERASSRLFGFTDIICEEHASEHLVTVITTTFNCETTVVDSVRSVLRQSHSNLEHIVIDDCSTDRTRELLQSLADEDSRVKLIFNDVNVGTYVSKNKGLACYEGDFVTFHDSDDWMHPLRLEKHVKYMLAEPTVMLSSSSWFRMDEQGFAIAQRHGAFVYRNPASTFFRRSAQKSVGFFDSVRTGADTEMLNRVRTVFGKGSAVEMKIPLTIGLHHSASLTQSGAAAIDEYRFSATRLAYWEGFGEWHIELERLGTLPFVPQRWEQRPFEVPITIDVKH